MAHFYTGATRIGAQGMLRIPNEAITARTVEVRAVLRHCVPNKGLQPIAASPIPAFKPENAKLYSMPNFSKKYSQTH